MKTSILPLAVLILASCAAQVQEPAGGASPALPGLSLKSSQDEDQASDLLSRSLRALMPSPSCDQASFALKKEVLEVDLGGALASADITAGLARIHAAPAFDDGRILDAEGVAGIVPADAVLFLYVHGPIADLARVVLGSVDPKLRQFLDEAVTGTGLYEDLDALVDGLGGALDDRLAIVVRANSYPKEVDGPKHDGTPVFAATVVTWIEDEKRVEIIRDTIGRNGKTFGLGTGKKPGYFLNRIKEGEFREYWSMAIPGTGMIATGNFGERCLVTNTAPMLDHLLKTDSQGGEDYARLSERRDFQALIQDSLGDANLVLWIDPDGAEEALRKRADELARTVVRQAFEWGSAGNKDAAEAIDEYEESDHETVDQLLLKVKLDDERFMLSLRAIVPG
jgi:hypothetical protein